MPFELGQLPEPPGVVSAATINLFQLWSPEVVLEQPWMCPGCRRAQPGQAQPVLFNVGLLG